MTGRLLYITYLIIFLHRALRQPYNLTLGQSNSKVAIDIASSHFAVILQSTQKMCMGPCKTHARLSEDIDQTV